MEMLVDQLVPFVLVLFRLSGLFVLAPLLASVAIPGKAKALLVLALGTALWPAVPPMDAAALGAGGPDVFALGAAVVGEVLVGLVIGFLGLLPVLAVQVAGVLMGQQMGFGLASIYNPALETESDLLGELLLYIALGAFVALGGVEVLFECLLQSFSRVPLGEALPLAGTLELVMGALGTGFELALRVSTPLMAMIFFETLATAFLSKTMPQMNVAALGFAIKILIGLVAIVAGLKAMDGAVAEHIREALVELLKWTAPAAGGPAAGA